MIAPGPGWSSCVIGIRRHIGPGVEMRDTVINGADRYETTPSASPTAAAGLPDLGVGEGSGD